MSEVRTPADLADKIERTISLHKAIGADSRFTMTVSAAEEFVHLLRLAQEMMVEIEVLRAEVAFLKAGQADD